MNPFDQELSQRLDALRQQGLHRQLRRLDSPQSTRICWNNQSFLNFSSNDYLGLATNPRLRDAACAAVATYGAGSGASRLICGSLAPHHQLEEALAAFKGAEAALSFSTGYAAALGTITALVDKDDIVVLDKLVHASIVDAARLSGAKLRVFDHNDLSQLEEILLWANRRHAPNPAASGTGVAPSVPARRSRVLIVTESIFSMDGDQAPLAEMVALKERHGAWLMVDEAHGTGLFGPHRRGLAEALGVAGRIEVQMGTLGKALGASGGYIAGSRLLIDYLVNRARSFIFSTAPVPAAAAAAAAAVEILQSAAGETLRQTLWQRVRELPAALGQTTAAPLPGPIISIVIGDETCALDLATALREQGIFIPAIRYPTVARGAARLRLTLTAAHTADDLRQLAQAFARLGFQPRFGPVS